MTGALPWRAAGTVVVLVMLAALRVTAALDVAGDDAAALRLSWSARPERIETCRRLTDEELAERPAHMRLRLECTGSFAHYRLTVLVDSQVINETIVRGGGLRNDRPMHLFEEFRVPAGRHRFRIALLRVDSASVTRDDSAAAVADTLRGNREAREIDERRRRAGEAIPPSLLLDTIVALDARRVLLVTYDGQRRTLVGLTEEHSR